MLTSVYARIYESISSNATTSDDELLIYIQEIYRAIWPDSDLPYTKHQAPKSKILAKNICQDLVEELSARELEILDLISQGISNQDIAQKLFLSLGTVKWYTSNIYGKLGVKNRTQAATMAQELNLLNNF